MKGVLIGMGIISWIILGAISGWLASKLTRFKSGMGCFTYTAVGILGAVIGGAAFAYLGEDPVTGFNVWSLFVSVTGAAILLLFFNILRWIFKS